MSLIKNYLLEEEREFDSLMESYLDWVEENKDLFNQLPKNIQDLIVEREEDE